MLLKGNHRPRGRTGRGSAGCQRQSDQPGWMPAGLKRDARGEPVQLGASSPQRRFSRARAGGNLGCRGGLVLHHAGHVWPCRFRLGVIAAAIYLEEFAPKNRWTDLVEVNINNLAAVPSIVYGLLGLAVFLNFFGLPRSAPLVGGMVLALMTLPTIIISSRAALKAVPPSIREAARWAWAHQPRAGGDTPRAAAGHAGYSHRHHHRPGAGTWEKPHHC